MPNAQLFVAPIPIPEPPMLGPEPPPPAPATIAVLPPKPHKVTLTPKAAGGLSFTPAPPLPQLASVNAGATAEILRLQELEQRILAFSGQQAPTERGLPPLAAIAFGALQAIAPERAAQLRPEVERVRNLDIEQFNRERQTEAQSISAEADLAQAFTGAEGRQQEQLQQQQAVQGIMESANQIIEGGSQAARLLSESGDPTKMETSKELMRRVLMFRELVSGAQQADPGAVGPQFVEAALGEIQGIQAVLDQQRGFEQKLALQENAHQAALQRVAIAAALRAAAMTQKPLPPAAARAKRDFETALESLGKVTDILKENPNLGGYVAGHMTSPNVNPYANELNNLMAEFANLNTLLLPSRLGAALPIGDRDLLQGITFYTTDNPSEMASKLNTVRRVVLGNLRILQEQYGGSFPGELLSSGIAVPPQPGDVDLDLEIESGDE